MNKFSVNIQLTASCECRDMWLIDLALGNERLREKHLLMNPT
jgi:hypothetical protein